MSRCHTSGLVVLIVLLSFVTALTGSAPAQATVVDTTIGYRCSSSYGTGPGGVRILATIPDRVAQGVTVPARRIRFRIRVPRSMVDTMRSYGVTSVSAVGRAHFTVGTLKRPIRHLHIPETEVPDSGGMLLRGRGRAAAFVLYQPGTYKVKVTRSLTATATARGGFAGDGASAALACAVRRGESRTLATLQVVR